MKQTLFCRLEGEHFSPKKLEEQTGLTLSDCLERENNPDLYGRANLFPPKNPDLQPIDSLAQILEQSYAIMQENGVETLTIWVLLEIEGIGNWEMSPESMAIFGKLGVQFCLSVLEEEKVEV